MVYSSVTYLICRQKIERPRHAPEKIQNAPSFYRPPKNPRAQCIKHRRISNPGKWHAIDRQSDVENTRDHASAPRFRIQGGVMRLIKWTSSVTGPRIQHSKAGWEKICLVLEGFEPITASCLASPKAAQFSDTFGCISARGRCCLHTPGIGATGVEATTP